MYWNNAYTLPNILNEINLDKRTLPTVPVRSNITVKRVLIHKVI